jgi:anthranilate phosphoribosyltransferase
MFSPSDLGVEQIEQEAIFGGSTVDDAAKIFVNVISGKGSEAQNNVVLANAGLAIATSKQISHKEGFELAKESLLSGKAKQSLDKLIGLSK